MKTSSINILKLGVALQNMHSAERLQMAAFGIVMISITSNGCLETSLKIDSWSDLNFRSSLDAILEKKPVNKWCQKFDSFKVWWQMESTSSQCKILTSIPKFKEYLGTWFRPSCKCNICVMI